MADILPTNFPAPTERSIATYNYTDIAEGTGVVIFYAGGVTNSAGEDFILATNPYYGKPADSSDNDNSSPILGIREDLDFDITFNMPQRIKGNAIVTIPFAFHGNSEGTPATGYVIAKIRKWDGTSETEIASVQSETTSTISTSNYNDQIYALKIPITTLQDFKAGETLRLTIQAYAGGTGRIYWRLGHDPMDRTLGTFDTSQLRAQIPFVLDL